MNNSIIESCNVYFTYCVTGDVGQKKTTLENWREFCGEGIDRFAAVFQIFSW